MGDSKFNLSSLASHTTTYASKSKDEIFTSGSLDPSLNPALFKVRESVDSPANPNSTPIIIGADVTGSMGVLAENIVKHGLETVVKGLYGSKPVSDPHILICAIGDSECDHAPLQATQFEASIVLMEQAKKIWLEGGGGGNNGESYPLVWAFAANKVKADCIDKRHKKGYIFTIGDERALPRITHRDMKFLGLPSQVDIDVKDLLEHVRQSWYVYHLIVKTAATHQQKAEVQWHDLLGDNAVVLQNHENIGEMITALIQLNEGKPVEDVAKDWDPIAAAKIKDTLKGRKLAL